MKKHLPGGMAPSIPVATLADKGGEALRLGRFKEAVEHFKYLIRQDARPEWRRSLADAYAGRARALAAKGMCKEAMIVLENTMAPDGTVREPVLYLRCLIRQGHLQKAAAHSVKYIGADIVSAAETGPLTELAAALLLASPVRTDVSINKQSEGTSWADLYRAAHEALTAWINGLPDDGVDQLLNRIPLRSPFKPMRLILKSLITAPGAAERSVRLLEMVPRDSVFDPLRQAVQTALLPDPAHVLDRWSGLSAAQQSFIAEVRGLPNASPRLLNQLLDAERNGPAALFSFLVRRPADLPTAEVRTACLNLLPQVPDRLSQFERCFGALPELQRNRVLALAAEARNEWRKAERSWREVAACLGPEQDGEAGLSRAVIYRHLAHLAQRQPEIQGEAGIDDPIAYYLERSLEADPDHLADILLLMEHYQKQGSSKEWHRLVEVTARRFPDETAVLLHAVDSAVARKAYKKAAGFARRLLTLDPINQGARERMIELQTAHARKQMRADRPDLAWKELLQAAEWEPPDIPSGMLRIGRGLVGLRLGQELEGEAWLREGVRLVGGGIAGWFRATLEARLMGWTENRGELLRRELAQAQETEPSREGIMSVIATLGQPEIRASREVVSQALSWIHPWLLQGSRIPWLAAEFHAIAATFHRHDAFDLLQAYARHAVQREPEDPTYRFYRIVARTEGDIQRLSLDEEAELFDLAGQAVERHDFHSANRIHRFLDGPDGSARLGAPRIPPLEELDPIERQELTDMMIQSMPDIPATEVDALVAEFGRQGAIEAVADTLRDSPLRELLPEPLLRELGKAMVAKAMDRRSRSRAGRF